MELYSEGKKYKLYQGDMLNMLDNIEENSIDSIVTDPPYEIGFMGKEWDSTGIAFRKETWEKCLKVLKPGGYLLAFSGARTSHRMVCAIEDAGFEVRDNFMWVFGSGMPKSLNIGLAIDKKNGVESKVVGTARSGSTSRAYQSEETTTAGDYEVKEAQNEWNGWGTAVKPAYEPIVMARKPFKGTVTDNVLKYGVGGINIDECRVCNEECGKGRFPANLILTYDGTDFEEVCGGFPNTKGSKVAEKGEYGFCFGGNRDSKPMADGYDDSGSACRYFYCAKASTKDREEGLEDFVANSSACDRDVTLASANVPMNRSAKARKNTHMTVKPTDLMQYLVRLVTPKGGVILDPFNGSGSTGKAVMYENKERNADYSYVGIELNEEYLSISKARIDYVNKDGE